MAMGIGKHYFSAHAIRRVRERWPAASEMSKRELLESLASSIQFATDTRRQVKTPGGLYVPFSLGGLEGFLVVKEDCVVTAVPKEWAQEVSEYLTSLEKTDG